MFLLELGILYNKKGIKKRAILATCLWTTKRLFWKPVCYTHKPHPILTLS